MAAAATDRTFAAGSPRRALDHGLIGMALFVFTEVMLFAAFISGFFILKNGVPVGAWPPPDQPRLPFGQTAFHTLALLASGALLYIAHRRAQARGLAAAERPLLGALVLGVYFVVAQGVEWAGLLRQGLTLTSSQIGAFFYVIVGAHALHAIAAILALAACWTMLKAGRLKPSVFGTTQLFWYFVVLVWPFIFLVVYR